VFHFRELNREVRVLDDVNCESYFHAIDFMIVLIFNGSVILPAASTLQCAAATIDAVEIETSRAAGRGASNTCASRSSTLPGAFPSDTFAVL